MTAKKILTRDDILNAKDSEIREVDVPEWGGTVRLKTMTGAERDELESMVQRKKKIKNRLDLRGVRALLLSLVIVDEKGEQVFTKEDLEALNGKAAKPLNDVFSVAQEMNGLSDDSVKEMMGNSGGDQSDEDG